MRQYKIKLYKNFTNIVDVVLNCVPLPHLEDLRL